MDVKTIRISRRRLLVRGAAAVFAGMAAALMVREPALAKAAKSDLLYQDHPHEGKKCMDCKYFSAAGAGTGTCAMVEGTVSANGWCQAFSVRG
jgi:hypothetical protein